MTEGRGPVANANRRSVTRLEGRVARPARLDPAPGPFARSSPAAHRLDLGAIRAYVLAMQLPLPSRRTLDRVRYVAGHRALAMVLSAGTGMWHRRLGPDQSPPPLALLQALRRRFRALLAEDLSNAEAGVYPRALAMALPTAELLRALPEALRDMPRVLRRKQAGEFTDLPEAATSDYPDYYKRTFHWQTDGWLSEHSARVYDFQVELLFFGTMDVMRRMALAQLVDGLRGLPAPRVLDVACGTGRLLRQIQIALPAARPFGVDLSPFYVQRAQTLGAKLPGASLLVGNAEALPLADSTFDAVSCGFLFHEMPHDARRRSVRELARVLKPGGLCVVQDSAQWGDPNAEELRWLFEWFPRAYHEPYYKGYLSDPLGGLLAEAGLTVTRSSTPLLSKVVVAQKG